jgi:hypothetical protein
VDQYAPIKRGEWVQRTEFTASHCPITKTKEGIDKMLKKLFGLLMIMISFGSTKTLMESAAHAQQVSGSDAAASESCGATCHGG